MASNTIEIDAQLRNFDQINKALQDLPGRIAGRVLQSALRFGAGAIVREARQNLKEQGISRESQLGVKIRNQRRQRHTVSVRVGFSKDYYYLGFIERGTDPHTIEAGEGKTLGFKTQGGDWPDWTAQDVEHPGQRARAWLRPAFDTTQEEVMRRFAEKIWERIEKETEKLKDNAR